jgi:hypothetical protein
MRHLRGITYTGLFSLVVLVACDSNGSDEKSYSKEHRMLIGSWSEVVDKDNMDAWVFGAEDVQWKSYTHPYELLGDKLSISGLNYKLVEQSMDTVVLLDPFNNMKVLTRTVSSK